MLIDYLENKKPIATYRLKLLLVSNSIIDNCCDICKLENWLNKPISLHLHHKDGNRQNNSLKNLQLLCPNCHSQTNNYAGKNKKSTISIIPVSDLDIVNAIQSSYTKRQALLKLGLVGQGGNYKRISKIMLDLNVKLLPKSNEKHRILLEDKLKTIQTRYENYQNMFKTKIIYPKKDELEKLLLEKSCRQIGRELGVSDNTIRNVAKKYGINIRAISKWSQRHNPKNDR